VVLPPKAWRNVAVSSGYWESADLSEVLRVVP